VTLPGQGRQLANSTAAGSGSETSTALLEKTGFAPAPEPILKSAAPVEPVTHAESSPPEAAIAPSSPDMEKGGAEEGDAAGDSTPNRRRRRRRSSVSADESAS